MYSWNWMSLLPLPVDLFSHWALNTHGRYWNFGNLPTHHGRTWLGVPPVVLFVICTGAAHVVSTAGLVHVSTYLIPC